MKLSYDAATDSLYIHLNERASVDSDEVISQLPEGVRQGETRLQQDEGNDG